MRGIDFPCDHLDCYHAERVCCDLARSRIGIGIKLALALDHPPRKQHPLRDRYAERVAGNCRQLAHASRWPPRMPWRDPHAMQRSRIERQERRRGSRGGFAGHPDGIIRLARQRLTAGTGPVAQGRRC